MDWTAILARAGVPEPPGREEAALAARETTEARLAKTGGPKKARGTNTRKPEVRVSRKTIQEQERRARQA